MSKPTDPIELMINSYARSGYGPETSLLSDLSDHDALLAAELEVVTLRAQLAVAANDVLDYAQHTVDCEIKGPGIARGCDCEVGKAVTNARLTIAAIKVTP